LALPQRLTLAFTHTNDRVLAAVDPDLFADGVDRPHLIVDNVGTNDGHLAVVLFIDRHKPPPVSDIHVVDRRHGPGPSANIGIRTGVAVIDHLAGGICHGSGAGAILALRGYFTVVVDFEIFAFLVFVELCVAEDDRRLFGR